MEEKKEKKTYLSREFYENHVWIQKHLRERIEQKRKLSEQKRESA